MVIERFPVTKFWCVFKNQNEYLYLEFMSNKFISVNKGLKIFLKTMTVSEIPLTKNEATFNCHHQKLYIEVSLSV